MSLLRLVIACLVMAALPLQGIAAASMLFCGSQAAARVAEAAASHHGHHASMGASMDAAVHDHAPASDAASGDTQAHSCPICAACSQAQAVGGFDALPLAAPAPSAEPSQPPVRVSSRALTLPDKPPRA